MDLEKLVQPTVNQLRKTVSFLTCAPRFDVPDVAHLKGKQYGTIYTEEPFAP